MTPKVLAPKKRQRLLTEYDYSKPAKPTLPQAKIGLSDWQAVVGVMTLFR